MLARESLRDRVVAADPGLTRLAMAARATASVGVALAVLLAASHVYRLPISVALLGAALCITWTIAVTDDDPGEQRKTTLLLWFPAAASVAVGTLTASNRVLSDALFLAVLFTAVYTRRYGPRANALGMIAVLGFFFTLFLRASAQTLPWLMLALAISAITTYVFRFAVLRDRPVLALHNAAEAFRARRRLIAQTLAQARQTGVWTNALKRRLDHHLYRLNEAALSIDDLLHASGEDELRAQVLDAELEIGAIAERTLRDLSYSSPLPDLNVSPDRVDAKQWTPRGLYRVGTQIETRGLSPSMRQAIQLTLAAAVAMIAGELLSPQRWYWAVLTTFLVFTGTASSGETLAKGWSRVAGTALGIAAGAAIAILVRGREAAALSLMFVFLFAAVYAIRLSYAVFTFFLTAVLSMLYVLLGLFSDRLLVLRLVETAVGAACGGLAATVVLPIRTQAVLGNVSIQALERLAAAVDAAIRRLGGDIHADPLTSARMYDEAMQSVRAQIEPLVGTVRFAGKSELQARLLLYGLLARYVRGLASLAYEAPPDCDMERIRREAGEVTSHIRELMAVMRTNEGTVGTASDKPPEDQAALTYLYRIDRAIHRLAATIRQGTAP